MRESKCKGSGSGSGNGVVEDKGCGGGGDYWALDLKRQ